MKVQSTFIYVFQIIILEISYFIISLFFKKDKNKLWIIGTLEISNNINFLGKILSPAITVNLVNHPFYAQNKYDYTLYSHAIFKYKFTEKIKNLFFKPILLAYLIHKGSHFFYIWYTGFLEDRTYEFKFLKKKKKKIVCMFVGSDIRAPRLVLQLMEEIGVDRGVRYHGLADPYIFSDEWDDEKRKIANLADKYSNLIISAAVDQKSYIKNKQYPFLYMYPKEKFFKHIKKFENIEKITILHAPSNPLAKGTQLVRSAIKRLKIKGYNFEYIELQNKSNIEVLQYLEKAHIVMVEFFPYTIGLLVIEAMANNCVVMTSADPSIETSLPSNAKDAWLITKHWEIHDNLKFLLDNPKKLIYYANNGYNFAYKNYTIEAGKQYLYNILEENNVI
jgi:hypothetical protein